MRPIHVGVLLLSGALGGALIMRVMHPEKPSVPVVARVQSPVAIPPEQPTLARPEPSADTTEAPIVQGEPVKQDRVKPEPVRPEPTKPSPMPPPVRTVARREAARMYPFHNVPPLSPELVRTVAQNPDPPSPTPAPPPVSTNPRPEPVAPAPPEVSAASVPQPHQVTLNAGFVLPVRLVDGLSSEHNVPGDSFVATLDKEVVADGFVIAERGARVEGRVVAVDRAKMRSAALALELTRLHTSDGQTVPIQTENFFQHARTSEVSNAGKIGGGAILGAAIGAIVGGGKGAAIGAGIGGGAGVGDVLLTRRPAELASETLLTFTLKTSVPLTEKLR